MCLYVMCLRVVLLKVRNEYMNTFDTSKHVKHEHAHLTRIHACLTCVHTRITHIKYFNLLDF
jgi:hypothetical protein